MSSGTDFARLKRINPSDRLLIFGYLREFETVLLQQNGNNPYYNVPELCMLLTLLYYTFGYEILKFDPEYKSDAVKLKNNNKAAYHSAHNFYHILCGGEVASAESPIKCWRMNVC